ncbi:hypothetical protein M011DRAFT_468133 [Sporormia fimetaria CBS 119925]|uniref:PXA domain-containing protein n=1 Tax=Sporormia fimetaria CBS 119925 TaxID=1340428 RepID=A0A6A6V8A1_9PLEO|nr:hypothetical protein M011DRAFT_468133 [Sporormia fimetaria CBS 119925]
MSEPIQTSPSVPDGTADKHPPDPTSTSTAEDVTTPSKDEQTPSLTPNIDLKALTDRTLHFLSTASNETLGACLVGLGAGTYLVLGRVGLILIGVVGGVVLHASWEGQAHHGRGTETALEGRKRETGVDLARRVLEWRTTAKGTEEQSQESDLDVKVFAGKQLDFSDFRSETASALTELTDAVIRDYVKWWYSPILPTDTSFPAECRQTLTAFLISVSTHLSRKRPADTLVDFVTRSSSFMIIFFQELSAALTASPGDPVSEAVDAYLEMKPDSTLSDMLDTKHQERQFSMAADDILQSYLDPKTYNCRPAKVFLRQILANVVLEMVAVSCSKPEWINGWIVYLLEDGEPELMHAIDVGVEGSAGQLRNVQDAVSEKQPQGAEPISPEQRNHKRVVSKAQEAMDEAMREAQRLSQMIAEEEARRLQKQDRTASISSLQDDKSESTTQGIATPSSSQSENHPDNEIAPLAKSSSAPQAAALSEPFPAKAGADASPQSEPKRAFTSFDQIVSQQPTALMANPPPPLTLHNCKIVIFDDSAPGDKSMIRSKPTAEYLIQIEPASNHYSGWMTVRKYQDLETLHEVLRRIAAITGASGFTEAHSMLPSWKGYTKPSLRGELERYLNDAVRFKALAESEGMKRFLEKESQMNKSPGSKAGFPGIGWPGQTFETMGKGMIDVLTKAPKEVAGGGKALFGGVTGVLSSVATPLGGAKKNRESVVGQPTPTRTTEATPAPAPAPIQNRHARAESTVSELPTHIRTESLMTFSHRTSTDSLRGSNSPVIDQQPQREPLMERRPSYNPEGDGKRSGRSSVYNSRSNSRPPSVRESIDMSPVFGGDQIISLPPVPSDIPDDYTGQPPSHSHQPSRTSTTSLKSAINSPSKLPHHTSFPDTKESATKPASRRSVQSHAPLSEPETTVLIELFFALVTELYSLSSAWGIRLTLLSAAKSFLLRPGNPQLLSIQQLLQSTVLDANTSDPTIAAHIRAIRAAALPTEDELKSWPKEMTDEEKEALRRKARRLLVERGMPQALTSVMGQVASGEALGRVFDALQHERVARGVMFGVIVQALRGVTQ